MSRQESIKHFQEFCRNQFSFLIEDFGFTELPAVKHHLLSFQSNCVGIEVKGVSWGSATEVCIYPLSNKPKSDFVSVPLWSIIKINCPDLYDEFSKIEGQEQQAVASAKILKDYFSPLLSGKLELLSKPREFLEQRVASVRNAAI